MAIPQAQLDTWGHQGATTTSSNAYASIRHALTKDGSPLNRLSGVDIFLQGSYANATNTYGDSDVDVVVLYPDTFHHDPTALTEEQRLLHRQIYPTATYNWHDLHGDVLQALRSHYGAAAVTPGRKSIKVVTGTGRRPSDVIPAVQYRRYARFNGRDDLSAHWGMQFFDSAGSPIINYPKYHIERGEAKNQAARTGGQYKSTIRVFKNLRSYMVDNGLLPAGVAPSYFIECALHNVPDALFRGQYATTVPAILAHLRTVPLADLRCQNGVTMLLGNSPTQWSEDDFTAFVFTATDTWNNW
jgi:hypothetical protein